jgi:hypothetical protein
LATSQSSNTFTISPIPKSLSVTPAAIDGVKEGDREQRARDFYLDRLVGKIKPAHFYRQAQFLD